MHTPSAAITQIPPSPEQGEAYRVSIKGNQAHPYFTFTVHAGAMAGVVTVKPQGEPGSALDWQTALSTEEKADVVYRMLSTYRERSRNESGFKVAALGVTETGNLYMAFNGAYNPSNLIRMCAELKLSARAEECETNNSESLRFNELYVLGDGPGAHITGLCGDCTNLENKLMNPQSPIYIFHGSNGEAPVQLDLEAEHIGEVNPGHVWITNIGYLTRHREIPLDEAGQNYQHQGLAALKQEIRHWVDKPIEEDPNTAIRQRDPHGKPLQTTSRSAKVLQRRSKLDIPLDLLNTYMREQIYLTVADRLKDISLQQQEAQDPQGLKPRTPLSMMPQEWIDKTIDEEVKWARCAVVQRDDGKLFASVTIKLKGEPASENAENTAMNTARRKKGGIRNVFVMEMHPRKTKEGILRTSTPVAVERQLKSASKAIGTVNYHYLPFNAGGLSAFDVANAKHHRDALQLFPTGHKGRHTGTETRLPANLQRRSDEGLSK